MTFQNFLKSYAFRYAMSLGAGVLFASFISIYFSFSQSFWIILVAFLVGQTTRGTALKQSLNYFFIVLASILLSAAFIFLMQQAAINSFVQLSILYGMFSIIFIFFSMLLWREQPFSIKRFFSFMLFPVIMMIVLFNGPHAYETLELCLLDCMIGGVIGVFFVQFIFPLKIEEAFKLGLEPLLKSLRNYSKSMMENFLNEKDSHIKNNRLEIENALASLKAHYPDWVYDVGLNRAFRSGFRFFLIKLEQVVELFFVLDFYMSDLDAYPILKTCKEDWVKVLAHHIEIFDLLLLYFQNKTLFQIDSDLMTDIQTLEKHAQSYLPHELSLIEFSKDHFALVQCLRAIKDMREILLSLLLALPESESLPIVEIHKPL